MKQIPLPIGPVPDPSFSSYLSQANIEAVAHLAALRPLDLPVYLWGPSGSGKTHLLRASLLARQERGERCGWWDAAVPGDWELQDDWTAVALDNCELLDAQGQGRAFAQFGARALWNIKQVDNPTIEQILAITRQLRIEGDMDARRLAERIEQAAGANF